MNKQLCFGSKTIAFFGDSLTDGSDYPDYVINTLNAVFPDYGIQGINAGVCGNRACDLINRLDRDVLSQKPDLTIIFIGTNDALRNVPLVQFRAELIYLSMRLKHAGSRVAFLSLTGNSDPQKAEILLKYSTIVREVASQQDAMYFDAWSLFQQKQSTGTMMYYAAGDPHHSQEGFAGVARAVLTGLGMPPGLTIERKITPPLHLITAWQETGAIENQSDSDFLSSVPECGWSAYDPSNWVYEREWTVLSLSQRGAWFPLQADGSKRRAFAKNSYEAEQTGLYELQLGGSGVKIWINRQLIYSMDEFSLNQTNGYHPNALRVPVMLNKGSHEIIITCHNCAFVGFHFLTGNLS